MDSKSKVYDIKPPNSVLFKLPELKDPVICICFSTVVEAQRTNADLFEKWRHEQYTLTLFATKHNANVVLNIYLISDNNQRLYKHLGFDQHKLNWWLQRTQGHGTKYKFCHVTQKFDKIEVVKPANQGSRYFVLNVKKVIVQDLMELSYWEKRGSGFKKIIKGTFNQRRKTIRNCIRSVSGAIVLTHPLLEKRPEQLSVEQFVELTHLVEGELKKAG